MTAIPIASAGVAPAPERQGSLLPWLPLAPLLAIPALGTSPESLDLVVIAIGFVFLFMAIHNPIWAIAAVLLSELTIRNFYLEFGGLQVSTRLFLALAIPIVVLPHLMIGGRSAGKGAPGIFVAAALFCFLAVVASLFFSDVAFAFKFGRYLATGLIVLAVLPLAVQNRHDLVQLTGVGLCIALASATAAILQHFAERGAPVIQLVPNAVVPEGVDAWQGRALGLAENPVYLTNDLLCFLFAPIAFLFVLRPERARLFLPVILLLVLGLYFSLTRSWLLGAVPGVAAVALLLDGRTRWLLLGLLVGGALFFWLWTGYAGNRYSQGPSDEDSAAVRPVLWSASAQIALDNPLFGVGHDKFLELSPEYAASIDRGLRERQDAGEVLGTQQPHNDFLNVWLSFGTIALALFVAIFLLAARNFVLASKAAADPVVRGIAIGGLGALVGYAFNSAFHNFFDSTLTIWLLAGFSIALINVAEKEAREASR